MLYYDFRYSPEELFVPLYEYRCNKCGHTFEKIEGLNASEVKKCPKCGAKAERTIASPAIQFKGSGWYVTDYAGKSSSSASDGRKSDSSTETKTSEPAGKESTSKKKEKA